MVESLLPKTAKLELVIPGDPVTWKRPRAGRSPSGKPFFFEDKKVKQWKYYIRDLAIEQMKGTPMLGGTPEHPIPLSLRLCFFLRRPRRLYKRSDPEGAVPCTSRPDIDNLYKGVADSLNGVVFRDDSLIYNITVSKMYHAKNSGPKTLIFITEEGPY